MWQRHFSADIAEKNWSLLIDLENLCKVIAPGLQLISDATESRFSLSPRITLWFFQAPLQDFPTCLSKFSSFFSGLFWKNLFKQREITSRAWVKSSR